MVTLGRQDYVTFEHGYCGRLEQFRQEKEAGRSKTASVIPQAVPTSRALVASCTAMDPAV